MNESPTILLVHGLVGSLHYYEPERRIENARIDAIDLLGYGALRHVPPGRLSLDAQVEHVLAHLELQGLEQVWMLGHSMGGAIAMLAADRRPNLVAAVINVEGNFTEKDAFWSRKVAQFQADEWQAKFQAISCDPTGWLERNGIAPTEQHVEWADAIFAYQPESTVYAMAHALVHETHPPEYLQAVDRVVARTPVHLVAGERSADAWDVPAAVRESAASDHVLAGTGHFPMLEAPGAFCGLIDKIVRSS